MYLEITISAVIIFYIIIEIRRFVYETGRNLVNGFEARCTTQIINPLSRDTTSCLFIFKI